MVKQYLEKYRQELLESQIELKKKYQRLKVTIKENIEFIKIIENSENNSFKSLSPREYYSKDSAKLLELKIRLKELEQESQTTEIELADLSQKIDELDSIIKVEKKKMIDEQYILKQLDDNEIIRLKLLETQELERQRIARELHDSTVQTLTGIYHKIELCSKLLDLDTIRVKLELQTMAKVTKETIQDMREIIYNLRPMSLDDIGLDVTLEREVSRVQNNSNLHIEYNKTGNSQNILPVIALSMLRVIQEACNNIVKHANASNILININYGENDINIEIKDDGIGFNAKNVTKMNSENTGFGISMMKERLFLLSGTINIESEKNKGTIVMVNIPRKKEDKENAY